MGLSHYARLLRARKDKAPVHIDVILGARCALDVTCAQPSVARRPERAVWLAPFLLAAARHVVDDSNGAVYKIAG